MESYDCLQDSVIGTSSCLIGGVRLVLPVLFARQAGLCLLEGLAGGATCWLGDYFELDDCQDQCRANFCTPLATLGEDGRLSLPSTITQLRTLGAQGLDLLRPYADSRQSVPASVLAMVDKLLAQADQVAGGNAVDYLDAYLVANDLRPDSIGNAPPYPVRYAAHVLLANGMFRIQRGETRPLGQYSVSIPQGARLLAIVLYDQLTDTYDIVRPLRSANASSRLPRFVLRPVHPDVRDIDGDTIKDLVEVVYGTDVYSADTDGDGVTDAAELEQGTDPLSRAIQVGEVIEGSISVRDEVDFYTFPALAGQVVYFDRQSVVGLSQVAWEVTDPMGNLVFDTCLGCTEPGVQVLAEAGTYRLLIGEVGSTATGTYRVQVWNVPPPQEFAIAIGDVVADGVPGAGAGRLESPGVRDVYRFAASAGEVVYFDLQQSIGVSSVSWRVTDSEGTAIFDTCLGCGDPGVRTLALGGEYRVTVGEDTEASTGTYRFQVWDVPPAQEFSIALGDVVSDGVPELGAGRIESPGVRDVYRFSVSAGQAVYFDLQQSIGVSNVTWRATDSAGTVIFDTCLGCGDPGVRTLALGGEYTVVVGEDTESSTGTYRFQISAVPPAQEFSIVLGDVVSDGVPGPGAGRVESPGVRDVYRFSVSAGQAVYFDLQQAIGVSSVSWRATDSAGTVVFDTCLGCGDPGARTLTRGGVYTITVGESNDSSTGTYRFQVRSGTSGPNG